MRGPTDLTRHPRALLVVLLVALVGVRITDAGTPPRTAALAGAGLVATRSSVMVLPPGQAGAYVPGSSVLALPSGRYLLPDGEAGWLQAAPTVVESRTWLATGSIPGRTPLQRGLAERALLDLRALTAPGGGVVASWHSMWDYVWPRDASWAAAAYCLTGHYDEGLAALRFLARVQRPDGRWEARYRPDGTPVKDGRRVQLDANGWYPWAAWLCLRSTPAGPAGSRPRAEIAALWPTVVRTADAAADSLRQGGLPPPSPDYWEKRTHQVTLGVVGPLRAGLRASADFAHRLGHDSAAARYRADADRLHRAIAASWGSTGYRRTAHRTAGYDAAVAFVAPPFAPPDPATAAAVRAAEPRLRVKIGGIRPGERWTLGRTEAWTPETAFFALLEASSGNPAAARADLDWLAAHRTSVGALAERVSATGAPISVAPLSWTCAAVLLTLVALESPLPIPPA
ncbi:MAG TPA: glycoside hydrolase family 15 [Actinomycetes bacterium]|nr:glycoside hydrolase family 15 [Actinomycetes bacterium]